MPNKKTKYSVEIQTLSPSDCVNGWTHRALLFRKNPKGAVAWAGYKTVVWHKMGGSALQSVNNLRAFYLAGRHNHTTAEGDAIQAALDAAQKGIVAMIFTVKTFELDNKYGFVYPGMKTHGAQISEVSTEGFFKGESRLCVGGATGDDAVDALDMLARMVEIVAKTPERKAAMLDAIDAEHRKEGIETK